MENRSAARRSTCKFSRSKNRAESTFSYIFTESHTVVRTYSYSCTDDHTCHTPVRTDLATTSSHICLSFFLIGKQKILFENRDFYFLRKLLNLEGDDGFQMNPVLVSLWYIMGFWPLVYSMLLLPTGRSSKSKVPVWPFLVMSFFGGAYALIPYFILWRPPPPIADKEETGRWPLKFLESKITAVTLILGGVVLTINAGLAGADAWKEFFQYFRESKFIHATCIDFLTLSSLSPFWVYNDMTIRNWFSKGYWLLPLTLVPYLGPTLYLALRPPLPSAIVMDEMNS